MMKTQHTPIRHVAVLLFGLGIAGAAHAQETVPAAMPQDHDAQMAQHPNTNAAPSATIPAQRPADAKMQRPATMQRPDGARMTGNMMVNMQRPSGGMGGTMQRPSGGMGGTMQRPVGSMGGGNMGGR